MFTRATRSTNPTEATHQQDALASGNDVLVKSNNLQQVNAAFVLAASLIGGANSLEFGDPLASAGPGGSIVEAQPA
jgi:hypothetical protein